MKKLSTLKAIAIHGGIKKEPTYLGFNYETNTHDYSVAGHLLALQEAPLIADTNGFSKNGYSKTTWLYLDTSLDIQEPKMSHSTKDVFLSLSMGVGLGLLVSAVIFLSPALILKR
ncbi:MAG: hypothetical protein FJ161_04035 [Gammaproteobacteria bacterium]|nr:hypothetical protein [Gammaproteobacteria bacterium]